MFASPLGAAGCDLKVYAANGWDRDVETNGVKTCGGRLGWTVDGRGGLGLSIISGEDDPGQSVKHTVVDVDATFTPSERLTLGAEFSLGSLDDGATDAGWTGFMVMAHTELNETLGLTGRFDALDDADDAIFGAGAGQRRSSLTVAPELALGEGMRALTELRLDMSDVSATWGGSRVGAAPFASPGRNPPLT
jgi:hypothetical protein